MVGSVPGAGNPPATLPMNLGLLRATRLQRHLRLQEVAEHLQVSLAQIQRLEKGERHMTLDMLEAYCGLLGIDPLQILTEAARVPIIGVVDQRSNILPLPAGSPVTARVPPLVPDPERLAAVRWEARSRFELLTGFLMLFYADVKGIAPGAWHHRSIIRRTDGTQRTGWLFRKDGQIHIPDVVGPVEFNVNVEWASPIIATIMPAVLAELGDGG